MFDTIPDSILALVFLIIGPIWYVIRSIFNWIKPEKDIDKEEFIGFSLEKIMSVLTMMLIGALIIIPAIIAVIIGSVVMAIGFVLGA